MARSRVRYEAMTNFSSDSAGDPAEHGFPTAVEAPWEQYNGWKVTSTHKEAPVGKMTTFRGEQMTLVRDEKRRAIGVQNALTGVVRWVSMHVAPFGSDQLPDIVDIGDWMKSGLATKRTPLARALQNPNARAQRPFVDEDIVKRNGNPKHRSIFKPQFGLRGERVK